MGLERLKGLIVKHYSVRVFSDHTPRILAMGVVTEGGELLQLFRTSEWGSDLEKIAEESADVLIYLLALSHTLGFDLEVEVEQKLRKNETRYPPTR